MKLNEFNQLAQSDPLTHRYRENIKKESNYVNKDPFFRFFRLLSLIEKAIKKEKTAQQKWLDLGCGPGNFASLVQKHFNFEVTAVDQWDLNDAIKSKNFTYIGKDIALEMDFPENTFSYISALEVIEHMIDTDLFLKRANRLLEKNGWLILSTPNINCLRNRIMVPFGKYPVPMEYKNIIHHVRLYNVPLLKQHLAEHGFKVELISGVQFFPEKFNNYSLLRNISIGIASCFPSLCNNIILVARKIIP